jgi:nucleoside-diphosphate-sugar epimerase
VDDFWRGRRVLVAGGAGFIGSYLVELLVTDGALVTVADNLDTGTLDNLSTVREKIRFLHGDLRRSDFSEEASGGQDVVMNLAAKAHGIAYSQAHHGEIFTDNSLINLNLLKAVCKSSGCRYLLVSSSCVYPDDAVAPTPEIPTFTREPERVNSGYGWSKRLAELQAQFYAAEYGAEIAIVRPFNGYGARCRWDDGTSHVIPSLVKKVMRGDDPVVIWGSGEQRRNFLHARDFAWGMKLVTERYAKADPVNLGLEETVSILELAGIILRVCGKPGTRIECDRTKPEGRFIKSADSTKLRSIVPEFAPRNNLEEGMREVVDWYRRCFPDSAKVCQAAARLP